MKKIHSKGAKGMVNKCSADKYQRFKHQWNGWDLTNEPAMVFFNCASEFCDNAVLSGKSDRKFEDIPDFFSNRMFTESYFEMMGKCATINTEAAARLHYIATMAVQYLNAAACQAPQNFQSIAESEITWPGFLSKHPDAEKEQKNHLFPLLNLGKTSGIRLTGKKFSLNTLETRIAFELWGKMQFIRNDKRPITPDSQTSLGNFIADVKRLPPLTRETSRCWWKAGEKMFLNEYGKEFEKHERFAGYWQPNHPAYKGEANRRTLIHRDIKKKIQQGFRSIAVKSSVV
jgi:hypothetical protein